MGREKGGSGNLGLNRKGKNGQSRRGTGRRIPVAMLGKIEKEAGHPPRARRKRGDQSPS